MLENRHGSEPCRVAAFRRTTCRCRGGRGRAVEIPRMFLIAGNVPARRASHGGGAPRGTRAWPLIDSSPVRGRSFFGANKPPRLGNWVAGFGVTPRRRIAARRGRRVRAVRLGDRTARSRQAAIATATWCSSRASGRSVTRAWPAKCCAARWRRRCDRRARDRRMDRSHADDCTRASSSPGAPTRSALRVPARHRGDTLGAVSPLRSGRRIPPHARPHGARRLLVRNGYVVFHWDDQMVASVIYQKKIF